MAKTLPTNQLTSPLLQVPTGRATPRPDGRTCVISSEIGPEDRQALLDLFARSSPETRRDRFHHALSVFPQLYLDEIAPGATTRSEDGMITMSVPLTELAAEPDARS